MEKNIKLLGMKEKMCKCNHYKNQHNKTGQCNGYVGVRIKTQCQCWRFEEK